MEQNDQLTTLITLQDFHSNLHLASEINPCPPRFEHRANKYKMTDTHPLARGAPKADQSSKERAGSLKTIHLS